MKTGESRHVGGFGLGAVIFIVFMTLKLCGKIEWSWWWVTAPLWIPFGTMVLFALLLVAAGIAALMTKEQTL